MVRESSSLPQVSTATTPEPKRVSFFKQYSNSRPASSRIVINGSQIKISQQQVIDNTELFDKETFSTQSTSTEQDVDEPTELGQALKELNYDKIQHGTRMSGIDMRAVLHYSEISGILGVDTLVNMKFLPVEVTMFTRQKKRLSVSLQGKGRNDIVAVVAGKRDQEARAGGGSFFDRVKNVFTGGGQQGGQP
jgi:hypothetical protein